MAITQKDRPAGLDTPLGKDTLVLRSCSGVEQLGRLFEFNLELVSEDDKIKFDDIIGQKVTLWLTLKDNQKRYFNGFVSRLVQTLPEGRYAHYLATVVPWFWFLTRTSDCRIFQEMTVPDIIEQIFRDHGFSGQYRKNLSGKYRQWEYCVQYRETAFNFVSRLMEQEGIYYFFEHEKEKHTLVMTDAPSAHQPFPNHDRLLFRPRTERIRDQEYVFEWTLEQKLQPGAYELNDFDFKAPQKELKPNTKANWRYAHGSSEMYDCPGEYVEPDEGDTYVRVRMEELKAQNETVKAVTDVRGVAPGCTFTLADYPRSDQNRKYLVLSASYLIRSDLPEAGQPGAPEFFSCRFSAMDAQTVFRTPRLTPQPIVQGPQTAIVCGPSGEEICTDKYGRVKVHFHWDRHDNKDDQSSCWIRVSQVWAGKNWGAMHIPRIGQEVIVEFLEGDPDRPIITGRVYNGDEMPPYDLPANKTQSGIKSRSSKGGSPANFNEIRFEDKKGSEQVYIHAEKNQDNVVENDETTQVGHDRTEDVKHDEKITIGNNRTEKVGVNEDITIGANRTEKVGSNENITIGANRTENVGSNESITVGSNRTRMVGANETITVAVSRTHTVGVNEAITVGAAQEVTVGAAQTVTVGAVQAITVGAEQATNVGASQSNTIGASQSTSVGADQSNTIGAGRTTSVAQEDSLSVGKKLTITAGEEIIITTGQASIHMKKDGSIQIQGKDINLKGSGKIEVKADSDVTIKGSKIAAN